MAIGDKSALPLAVCGKVPDANGNITLSIEEIEGLVAALRNKANVIGAYYGPANAQGVPDTLTDGTAIVALGPALNTELREKLGYANWAFIWQQFFAEQTTTTLRTQFAIGNNGRTASRTYDNAAQVWSTWTAAATVADLAGKMQHGDISLRNCATVLDMASSVPVDTSVFTTLTYPLTAAADSPAPGAEMQYLVLVDSGPRRTVIATQYIVGDKARIWQRSIYMGAWRSSKWIPIATAISPQEIDLPLAAGYTAQSPCKYSKAQDGRVCVGVDAKSSSAIESSATIATLPVGYRPAYHVIAVAMCLGSTMTVGTLDVFPDGRVAVYHRSGDITWVTGQISFLTA